MTPRDWTILAFRLFGIWLIIEVLVFVPVAFLQVLAPVVLSEEGEGITSILVGIVAVAFPLAVGALLITHTWWFVDRAFGGYLQLRELFTTGAHRTVDERTSAGVLRADSVVEHVETDDIDVITESEDRSVGARLDRDDFMLLGLSLLGVYVLTYSVPEAVTWISVAFQSEQETLLDGIFDFFTSRTSALSVTTVVAKLAIGFYLLLQPHRIVSYWERRVSAASMALDE